MDTYLFLNDSIIACIDTVCSLEPKVSNRINVLNNPVNLIDPEGLSHLGFIKKLSNMADKSLRKTLKSLEKNIVKHEKALKDPAQELAKKHHEHELKVFKEQQKLASDEAAKRGLIGILPFIGSLLDPFDAISGELAGPEYDMIPLAEEGTPCK